jgi:uncharacterized cupin superfamily protein
VRQSPGTGVGEHDLVVTAPMEMEEHVRRLNFLEDEPWDEVSEDRRVRWFGHPFETDMLGASLIELLPASAGSPLHLHYGVEEMFFVLAGTPTVRTPEGEEQLSPGDVVYFPEGREGLHDLWNPTDQPVRILGISTKRFPDVVAYPERGVAWVATRHPERPVAEGGDEGIIARFEFHPDE